jgi:23S rRNA (cytosine1962-C5)-methyltransferase
MIGLLDAALAKRKSLLTGDTDAVRLIDGAGDGLPGVVLETYADRLLASTTGGDLPPQVLAWLAERGVSCYLKRLDRQRKESPALLCGPAVTAPFLIREHGICYEISFQAGYSQGIFLDQRDNRSEVRRVMRPGLRLLNTFAYTGAFSVAAALAGAETTTLDLSPTCLAWAQRNFSHNRLNPAAHHFCKGDTFHWLRRFAQQGRRFDAIVLDPPTFSRDANGKIFRAEQHCGDLAALAAAVLAPDGWILCCTNFRGITPAEFARRLLGAVPRRMQARHTAMPADFTDVPYLKSVWLR